MLDGPASGESTMRIGVCLKQVPDTEARLRLNADGTWIDEEDLPFVINESDECALEQALSIAGDGDEVIAFSLGPDRASEALRKALALGASRAVHLNAPEFAGGDAISNGRALAAALALEELDLVLTGSQSEDSGYGSTATVIAEILQWPHAWLVMGIEIEGPNEARILREMEGGQNERCRIGLPAVLEVQAGINHPRYASLRGIMMAKKKTIETLSPADLGLAPTEVGAEGARIEVVSVSFPERKGSVELLEGDTAAIAAQLVDKLRTEARVL